MPSWLRLARRRQPLGVHDQFGTELCVLTFDQPKLETRRHELPKTTNRTGPRCSRQRWGRNPGDCKTISTRYGEVTVTIHGDPACTPCVTYHDVGLNHASCFQSLLVCSSTRPLLVKNFCFFHIDAPGSQDGAFDVSPDMLPMTMPKLADQVLEVISYFKLKEVVGLGVGAGGNVLLHAAAQGPGIFSGLILASPPCMKPGWWEWTMGKVALQRLKWMGMSEPVKEHIIARLIRSSGRSEDLANTIRIDLSGRNADGIHAFLSATLNREDISSMLGRVGCRVLLLCGDQSIYRADCLHMNTVLNKSMSSWVEIESAACLATEEKPHELLSAIKLFLQGLMANGYGFGWDLH